VGVNDGYTKAGPGPLSADARFVTLFGVERHRTAGRSVLPVSKDRTAKRITGIHFRYVDQDCVIVNLADRPSV